jgi:hypothetical protein
MNTKNREEIEALKQDWHADPCWDIEETEGFEAHREELEAYRLECEAAWQQAYEAESAALAVEIGHPAIWTLPGSIRSTSARPACRWKARRAC